MLRNLSFTLRPGEKIGIVGRTGSGKSSLIKLLWRALLPCEGRILIDGVDLAQTDLKSLRRQVMIVTQDTALFQGTLQDNLDPVMTAQEARLSEQLLKDLNFRHQEYLKSGLQMEIEAAGANLSQGEKQLISFSRILLAKKKVIIMDEATASIDLKTEEVLQQKMEEEFQDSTMLIIAHRIQTVMNCDRIMVLQNGTVSEFDSVDNLLQTPDSFFKKLVEKIRQGEPQPE